MLGYRHLALAETSDQWISGGLLQLGNSTTNSSRTLGNELDLSFSYAPFESLQFAAGYGAFLTGPGAKEILKQAGRGSPDIQHFGYFQATMNIP